jgi:flagellar protein FlaG
MEITQVLPGQQKTPARTELRAAEVLQAARVTQQEMAAREAELSKQEVRQFLREIQTATRAFNKRLSFRYHEELDQVVVKVIDRETDKVIKELPPSELQRVHLRIREAIGLLFDEVV